MSYFKPCIDEAGFHMPAYNEIKGHLIDEARRIFGQDIYLENDSQDYEFISIMADKIHDAFLTALLVFNNRGPNTAVGAALDGLVKLNGIKRKSATNSTCAVVITGKPGTVITNGMVSADNKTNWDLPSPLEIPDSGTLETVAVCQKKGSVYAAPEQLCNIVTPTNGWISVINPEAAVMGQSVEGQEELRARQTISTAKPSKTVLEGVIGGIAEIADVTRYRVYENDTNVTDENTVPGHSICAVVEGGDDLDIAYEIYLRKTPGCGTYGDEAVEIEPGVVHGWPAPESARNPEDSKTRLPAMYQGMPRTVPIRFFRPSYADIFVTVTVKRLPGYTSQTTLDIQAAAAGYLNSLQIGEDLTMSALWGAALAVMPRLTQPIFSIVALTAGYSPDDQTDKDIAIPFNYVTRSKPDNMVVLFK